MDLNQQQRRSKMTAQVTKDQSKNQATVEKEIKREWATLAKQNSWKTISGWKKPQDNWYNQVEDGAWIEIKVTHVRTPQQHFLVYFEGVPKTGKTLLRADVGTLPFTT
jgi:hypothetical protein